MLAETVLTVASEIVVQQGYTYGLYWGILNRKPEARFDLKAVGTSIQPMQSESETAVFAVFSSEKKVSSLSHAHLVMPA